jgi:hypothetical protein
MLNWTPEGMIGDLFNIMQPFAPPPPPGAQPPPLWGSENHLRELFGQRLEWRRLGREHLEISAFEKPAGYAEHFKAYYGPTIVVRTNAAKDGRVADLDRALVEFCQRWNRGTDGAARFKQEYILAIGTRT